MSEMVERVAKAIFEHVFRSIKPRLDNKHTWETCEQKTRDGFVGEARAVIEAMRSPDKKMLKAACKAMSPKHRPTQDYVNVMQKHRIRYEAMIDAALQEGKSDD